MEQLIDALSSRCESGKSKKLPTSLPLSRVVDILHDNWLAAGLIVSGKENDFKISYEKATKHLNSGNVFQYLEKIQSN